MRQGARSTDLSRAHPSAIALTARFSVGGQFPKRIFNAGRREGDCTLYSAAVNKRQSFSKKNFTGRRNCERAFVTALSTHSSGALGLNACRISVLGSEIQVDI